MSERRSISTISNLLKRLLFVMAATLLAGLLAAPTAASTPGSGSTKHAVAVGDRLVANYKVVATVSIPNRAVVQDALQWLDVTQPAAVAPNPEALLYISEVLEWLGRNAEAPEVPVQAPEAPAEITVIEVANVAPIAPVPAPAPVPSNSDALVAIAKYLDGLNPAPVATVAANGYIDLGHGVVGPQHLIRIRTCESTDRYDVVSKSGKYRGAYQFSQATWNDVAGRNGRPDLVGAEIASVSPADQDQLAVWNYEQSNPYSQWPVCSRR